eukprot:858241-Pyramimonas_sp.AAC.1
MNCESCKLNYFGHRQRYEGHRQSCEGHKQNFRDHLLLRRQPVELQRPPEELLRRDPCDDVEAATVRDIANTNRDTWDIERQLRARTSEAVYGAVRISYGERQKRIAIAHPG